MFDKVYFDQISFDGSATPDIVSYQAHLTAISRTPVTLVVMTLDFCGRTFGVNPCFATGTPCYNTFRTCTFKSAFLRQSRDYKFTSADTPLPFSSGERPYLAGVKYLPTEIKTNLTIAGRVSVEFYDEPDSDVSIDPYIAQRTSVQGTFFRKLLARNPNYKGRLVRISEGFLGLAEADFRQRWIGVIENIEINKNGSVKVEIVDLLKSIGNIEIPPKMDIKNLTDITTTATAITLTTVSGLSSPSGHVRIGDEIIHYTGLDTATNQLTGCARGHFGTIAYAHKANVKVQRVRHYPLANGFNILKEMLLTDAGLPAGHVDSTAFDYWRDWPGGEVSFSAIVSEPTKLDKLYFEIVDLLDCKSWVGEDLRVTIRRNIPNEPGRGYFTLTDEASIMDASTEVDLNEKSRLTRIMLYWDKTTLGEVDEIKEYNRLDIVVDADAESANEYNEVIEKVIYSRWLRSGLMEEGLLTTFIRNTLTRQLFRQRNAQPLINMDIELKDSDILTGSYCRVSTDETTYIDGSPVSNEIFQIVRRDFRGSKINMRLLKLPLEKWGFIAPNATPAFDMASDAQRESAFITENNGLINNKPGYYIW